MSKNLTPITIQRSNWYNGRLLPEDSPGNSALVVADYEGGHDGKMCCMGFLGEQHCGLDADAMGGRPTFEEIPLDELGDSPGLSAVLYSDEDSAFVSDKGWVDSAVRINDARLSGTPVTLERDVCLPWGTTPRKLMITSEEAREGFLIDLFRRNGFDLIIED